MSRNQFFAAAFSLAFVAGAARAQSEASNLGDVSALPIASVALGSQAAGASVAAPALLSVAAGVFVVQGMEASAYATVYTLERVSDGMRVSVQVAGRGVKRVSVAVGTIVTATALSTGIVLVAGSEAIAFVPNALGRALMHNERITS